MVVGEETVEFEVLIDVNDIYFSPPSTIMFQQDELMGKEWCAQSDNQDASKSSGRRGDSSTKTEPCAQSGGGSAVSHNLQGTDNFVKQKDTGKTEPLSGPSKYNSD